MEFQSINFTVAERLYSIFQRTREKEITRLRTFDARWSLSSPTEYRKTHVPRFDFKQHVSSIRVDTWATLCDELPEAKWIFENCILDSELVDQLRVAFPTDDPRAHISEEQRCTLVSIVAGYNLFVTGPAGTGKSKMISSARATLQAVFSHKDRGIMVCGSTGNAAAAVGGTTAHSEFALLNPTRDMWLGIVKKKMQDVDTIFLDEVSMLSIKDFYRIHLRIMSAGRYRKSSELVAKYGVLPFGGVQVVFVGDFFQLPPVEPGFSGSDAKRLADNQHNIEMVDFVDVAPEQNEFSRWSRVFATPLWHQTVGRVAYMVTVKRQRDLPFAQLLDQLRWGRFNDASWAAFLKARTVEDERSVPENAMCLYAKNSEANGRNAEKIAQLPGPDLVFTMTQMSRKSGEGLSSREMITGSLAKERSQVTMRVGAMGRLTRNFDTRSGIVNSALFRLVGLVPIESIQVSWRTSSPTTNRDDATQTSIDSWVTAADDRNDTPTDGTIVKSATLAHELDPATRALYQPAVDAASRACGSQLPRLLNGCGFSMEHSGNGGIVLTSCGTRDSSVYASEKVHPFAVPRDVSAVHRYTRGDSEKRGKNTDYEEPEVNLTRHFCAVVHFLRQPAGVHHVIPPAAFTLSEFRGKNIPLITQVQTPFIAAYASTVHSAQGLSLDSMATKITSRLDPALVYVALTRATSAEGLYIIGSLPLNRCRPPPEVSILYKAYNEARKRALRQHT